MPPRRRSRRAASPSRRSRPSRFAKQPAAALHHLDPAAGGGAQARLLGEPHDAGRAGALRGRADHLHADRRRRHGARGDQRRAPGDRQPLRCRLRARQAAPISEQDQECAGSARGDPADRFRPRPRAASGDHARLYELVYNRALASQMASARLERTTVELTDGSGPGACFARPARSCSSPAISRSTRKAATKRPRTRRARACRALREGDAPAKTGVEATQHFTQPPPRYSEASLVKRLEELGIGRPVDLCGDPADAEGPRICPRRQGPLHSRGERAAGDRVPRALLRDDTSATITPPSSRKSSTTSPAAGSTGRSCSRTSGATSSPRPARSWTRSRARSPRRSTSSSRPGCYPPRADGSDPRLCPQCGNGRLSLRGGKFGAFVACSNYPECRYTQKFGQGGDQAQSDGPAGARRRDPAQERPLRALCRARASKRASIPKDVPLDDVTPRSPSGCCRCRARSARIRRRASRSPPRSAATAPISPTTANMRSSARPPRCSRRA